MSKPGPRSKEFLRDEKIWLRMGTELAFMRDRLLQIICDKDYQSVMTGETFKGLERAVCAIDGVRNSTEGRMIDKGGFDWETAHSIFSPDRERRKKIENALPRSAIMTALEEEWRLK